MKFINNLFKGRLGRADYFFWISVFLVAAAPVYYFLFPEYYLGNQFLTYITSIIVYIYLIPLSIKRLHDIGMSGWGVLLLLIPYINIFSLLFLLVYGGDEKTNKYGPRKKSNKNIIWINCTLAVTAMLLIYYLGREWLFASIILDSWSQLD